MSQVDINTITNCVFMTQASCSCNIRVFVAFPFMESLLPIVLDETL